MEFYEQNRIQVGEGTGGKGKGHYILQDILTNSK